MKNCTLRQLKWDSKTVTKNVLYKRAFLIRNEDR